MPESHSTEPEVILFETSPYGNLDAIVQQNEETVYFFLNQRSENPDSDSKPNATFGMRACWVRNLVPGPLVFDLQKIEQGQPPVFPRTQTVSRGPLGVPDSDDLEIVWYEEGNAAALLEHQDGESRVLAVIPPWSGEKGFMGYSAECAVEHPFCAPIPDSEPFRRRIDAAREFWQSLRERPSQLIDFQKQQIATYQEFLKQSYGAATVDPPNLFELNVKRFPPRRLAEFRIGPDLIMLTTCVGFCPQPNVELSVPNPQQKRRIELGFRYPLELLNDEKISALREMIATIARLPWNRFVWLDEGHSIDFPNIFEKTNLVEFRETDPALGELPISMPSFRNDPIRLLWIVPGGMETPDDG